MIHNGDKYCYELGRIGEICKLEIKWLMRLRKAEAYVIAGLKKNVTSTVVMLSCMMMLADQCCINTDKERIAACALRDWRW